MKSSFIAVLHIGSSKDSTAVLLLGGRIVAAMTANKTTFPDPDPTMSEFSTQVTQLETYLNSNDGSDKIKEALATQTKLVYSSLKSLVAYANKVAKGDKAIIILSGFDSDEEATVHDIPDKVILKHIENGSTLYSLKIYVQPQSNADRYMVEITTTPGDPNSWKMVLNSVASNKLEVPGLARGVEVFVRVTAGNTHGWGPHSDVTGFFPQ